MSILLLLLKCLLRPFCLGQSPTHSPSLLCAQVLGDVFGSGDSLAYTLFLLLVVDGEDTGDGFAYTLDLSNFGCGTSCDLGDGKLTELLSVLAKSF